MLPQLGGKFEQKTGFIPIFKIEAETQVLLQPFFASPSIDHWWRDVLLDQFSYFINIDEKDAKRVLHTALKPLVPVGMCQSLDKIEDFFAHL